MGRRGVLGHNGKGEENGVIRKIREADKSGGARELLRHAGKGEVRT